MKIFKPNILQESIPDKAAMVIAKAMLKIQNWAVTRIENLTKNWKQKQQWIFLCSICIGFGAASLQSIADSFKVPDKANSILPKPISIPPNNYEKSQSFVITENEYQKVQEFKNTHPNLRKEKPTLFENLTLIEQVYYAQKKQYK